MFFFSYYLSSKQVYKALNFSEGQNVILYELFFASVLTGHVTHYYEKIKSICSLCFSYKSKRMSSLNHCQVVIFFFQRNLRAYPSLSVSRQTFLLITNQGKNGFSSIETYFYTSKYGTIQGHDKLHTK